MSERFGIEIEVGFPDGKEYSDVAEAIRRGGVRCKTTSRTHTGYSNYEWTVKRDGSLTNGCEVVSPPLDFTNEEDRESVTKVALALQKIGCRPIEDGSVHVHVEADDLNPKQVAAVIRFCWKFEDVLWRIASSGWPRIRPGACTAIEGYAKKLDEFLVKKATKVRTDAALRKMWTDSEFGYLGDRYQMVNLDNLWLQGTIEFRMFNSTINPERIQAYIAICVAIVRDARNGQSRSTRKNYPIGTMADAPETAAKMFLRFQQVMTCSSGDSSKSKRRTLPPIMAKKDWKRVLFCWKDSLPQRANNVESYI